MRFHTLASDQLDVVKYLSTMMNPRTLQMLRCTSKVFRDGADKEQCVAAAVARYSHAVLLNNNNASNNTGAFRLHSKFGYHVVDIYPITSDFGIEGLVYRENPGCFVIRGRVFNVVVVYGGRRFKGLILGDFLKSSDLGLNFFVVLGDSSSSSSGDVDEQAAVKSSTRKMIIRASWISMTESRDVEHDCVYMRIYVDRGGVGETIDGENFRDFCFDRV